MVCLLKLQRQAFAYTMLILSTLHIYVECGSCSDLPAIMDSFGRDVIIPTSQEKESVVYNITIPKYMASTVDMQLINGLDSFQLRQKDTNAWHLQTKTCIKINDTWSLELLLTLDSYTCPSSEFVSFVAEQAVPEYVLSIPEKEVGIGGDCEPGRTLNVYNLSSIITNASPCASFECSVLFSDNYPDFWIENGTIIQTFLDKIRYNQPYTLKARCFQTRGDPSINKDTNVTVYFKHSTACNQVTSDITTRQEKVKKSSKNCFNQTTCLAGVTSTIACLAGTGTVITVYFMS